MQDGVVSSTTTGREGVDDTKLFLNSTSNEISTLLVVNYGELSTQLVHVLRGLSYFI